MKRSGPLPRYTKLRSVNPERQKVRRKNTRQFHQTPAFIAAGAAALQRAGGRCEYEQSVTVTWINTGGSGREVVIQRCPEMVNLERHCTRYPKTRPIEAKDIQILCSMHHQYVEMTQFSYRNPRRFLK